MQVVVDPAQLRVRLHGLVARARHRARPPAATVVQARARRGEHRGAAGGGLDVLGPAHRQPGDVGAQLEQQLALGAAAHAHHLARAWPAPPIASITSRSACAFPSSSARARWARPCAAVMPNQPARAWAFHSGAIAPASAGTHSTPSAPGGAAGERVQQLVDVGAALAARTASSPPSSSRNQR